MVPTSLDGMVDGRQCDHQVVQDGRQVVGTLHLGDLQHRQVLRHDLGIGLPAHPHPRRGPDAQDLLDGRD